MDDFKLKIDALTFHYDNVGGLYGPHQVQWLKERGHIVNEYNINHWQKNIKLFNDSSSNILLTWGVDQHTIGEFFTHLPKLNRSKYKQVVHFTTEPVYTRFGFWMPGRNSAKQHDRYLDQVKPTMACYCSREDAKLSKHDKALWVCNNLYKKDVKVIPWESKENTLAFSGKYRGWEDYQWPEYKGLGRSQQLSKVKELLGDRFVHYPPNTFKMNDSLDYHNKHRFILSPRSGHIWHPRLSIAARIKSIPIIIVPDDCPERKWFPELKHKANCFVIKDCEIEQIPQLLKMGSAEMAENTSKLEQYHNFYDSMQLIEAQLIARAILCE